ncbi:MAG TPA: hypothetical protein VHU41_03375 [Thermoanaerobaculia bacterium]|jgi:hypothetical protein|nr:hypothetical protein [Thermoanaerobaculia bacterium]
MDNTTAAPAQAPQLLLCVVNRHQGYPPDNPNYRAGDVCELPDTEQTRDHIKIGYLIPATIEHPLFTPDLAKRVVAFQKRKAEQTAVQTSTPPVQEARPVDDAAARAAAEKAQQLAEDERRRTVAAILKGTEEKAPEEKSTASATLEADVSQGGIPPAAAVVAGDEATGVQPLIADGEVSPPMSPKKR